MMIWITRNFCELIEAMGLPFQKELHFSLVESRFLVLGKAYLMILELEVQEGGLCSS